MINLNIGAALLQPPMLAESAWLEHAPFAAWLIEKLRPKCLVELGTHRGYSYFAFCKAVSHFKTGTACHAVDSFKGDEHAGFYDDEIFKQVIAQNKPYENFSTIHRMDFSEALSQFTDGSVDLLHIDGRHFYDDVKEDYESWLPKLTSHGVVLFHDISVTERNFGAGKFFAELTASKKHFAFMHNNGLGILAPNETPSALEALFELSGRDALEFKELMEELGRRFTLQFQHRRVLEELALTRAQLTETQDKLVLSADQLTHEMTERKRQSERIISLEGKLGPALAKNNRLHEEKLELAKKLYSIETSTFWRLTSVPRTIVHKTPTSVRRALRLMARVSYWALTPHHMGARWKYLKENGAKKVLIQQLSGDMRADDRAAYARWIRQQDTRSDIDREMIDCAVSAMQRKPLLSIVMPVYNTPAAILEKTIQSVRDQLYPHWELCIADDASPAPHVAEILSRWQAIDTRIKVIRRQSNGHISAASNSALELASGDYMVLLDHDDLLAEHALYSIATALGERPDADILYSDEDKIDESGSRFDPYFKPDFSYDLMLGQNLINHLGVFRLALVNEVGRFREGFEGSQDYDLALRCLERTSFDRVVHIPEVLYHWRQPTGPESFSQTALQRCVDASRKALGEHLSRTTQADLRPVVEANPSVWSWNRVRWQLPDPRPQVSVIIPTRDHAALLKQCVEGLLHRTDYDNLEILIADNGSCEDETKALFESWSTISNIRVVDTAGPFNYSRINNDAVTASSGDVILLLNNDVDVIEPDWLTEMVSLAVRPDVGCVGAKLLYGDGRVQHAGVRLGAGEFDGGIGVAGHLGLFAAADDLGYFGSYVLPHEVSAVTAACLAVRRTIYEEVGGLNESDLAVAFNDIDFCLRVREAGYRNIWTPHATLFHLESASRGSDLTPEKAARFYGEAHYMRRRWGPYLDRDPFYSMHFDHRKNDYVLS